MHTLANALSFPILIHKKKQARQINCVAFELDKDNRENILLGTTILRTDPLGTLVLL